MVTGGGGDWCRLGVMLCGRNDTDCGGDMTPVVTGVGAKGRLYDRKWWRQVLGDDVYT